MKSIKVIVIGFILAIALVAWPVEYTRNITAGTGFLLGGVLAAWLGIRRRKGARKEYEDDVRRYTGTTMMKVVWIEESVVERWEHQEDGSDRPRRETYYLPTYEYTVNGTTYRYSSRQSLSGKRDLGRQDVYKRQISPFTADAAFSTSAKAMKIQRSCGSALPMNCAGSRI